MKGLQSGLKAVVQWISVGCLKGVRVVHLHRGVVDSIIGQVNMTDDVLGANE